MLIPDGGLDIDVQLDLVAIRILDVQAVGHAVVRRPDDSHAALVEDTENGVSVRGELVDIADDRWEEILASEPPEPAADR